MTQTAIALIDGEHLPDVTLSGITHARKALGYNVVAAVLLGGQEKLTGDNLSELLGIEVADAPSPGLALTALIRTHRPDVVIDLSDEPVVGYRRRFELAVRVLAEGVRYEGADFHFNIPEAPRLARVPSLSVVGTGKRVGKTAFGAYVARALSGREKPITRTFTPCIITMGRGGPPEPELIRGDLLEITPEFLLDQARAGKHAASDHFEDALMARVPTIGCRRCGGGFAGTPYFSKVADGARLANTLECDLHIYEGSGASLPPVRTDACLLTIGAFQALEQVEGFLGPLRVRRADLVVLTLCEEPMASPGKVEALADAVRRVNPDADLARVVFRPKPLSDVTGKRVIVATTAMSLSSNLLKDYLQKSFGCEVVGLTHELANRAALEQEFTQLIADGRADTALVEVKAAGIDVASRIAVDSGLQVVYTDNIPVSLDKEPLIDKVVRLADLAVARFRNRPAPPAD